MKVIESHLIKLILIFLNFKYFVKPSSPFDDNGVFDDDKEASGMDSNLMPLIVTWNDKSKYEQTVLLVEEKLKSLSKTFNQLELKMNSLINDKMDFLEENLRKMMNQIMDETLIKSNARIENKNNCNQPPKSCHDLNVCNNNIYSLVVPRLSNDSFPAVCDLKTLNGSWTVIQRRQDGSENFYRNWNDYVEGFGDLNGEFFIGLEKLYALTSLDEPQELYIIFEDFEGERRHARYGQFKVDSQSTEYNLTVGQYSGDAGDCFSQHSGHKFTTKDRDNDASDRNCAERWKGAWWYTKCFHSNLNGMYTLGKVQKGQSAVSWCGFRNYLYSLKFVQMMIRPIEE